MWYAYFHTDSKKFIVARDEPSMWSAQLVNTGLSPVEAGMALIRDINEMYSWRVGEIVRGAFRISKHPLEYEEMFKEVIASLSERKRFLDEIDAAVRDAEDDCK